MKLVEVTEKRIIGLSARTTNAKEMNPATGRIGSLWKEFDRKVQVDYRNGGRVYGVYFNYDSDAAGGYSVLAGTDQLDARATTELETIIIQSGKYLVFTAKGDVPGIVVDAWKRAWETFSKQDTEFERAYTTDFEYYVNQSEIELHIAVQQGHGKSV